MISERLNLIFSYCALKVKKKKDKINGWELMYIFITFAQVGL